MSVRLTQNIWQHSRAHGTALVVLLAIADYANADGLAWPSTSVLAARARLSERQTRRCLATLVEMGELSVEPDAAGTGARRYRITCPGPDLPLPPEPRTQNPEPGSPHPVTDDPNPVTDDLSSMTEARSSMTGETVIHDRAYKEVEPSINRHTAIELEKNLPSSVSVPPELASFDAEARRFPGYGPDARFHAEPLEVTPSSTSTSRPAFRRACPGAHRLGTGQQQRRPRAGPHLRPGWGNGVRTRLPHPARSTCPTCPIRPIRPAVESPDQREDRQARRRLQVLPRPLEAGGG